MIRIAMWSGPRNLSTAMMYSFAQRSDCSVIDEPFYAAYLERTGLLHPMREAIMKEGEADPAKVIDRCCGETPEGAAVYYQKHMTQHLLPEFEREWIQDVSNVFLLRDPARVLASYHLKRENPTLEDIGIKVQLELFDCVRAKGKELPIVVDSQEILERPEPILRGLCKALGIAFESRMLSWESGPKPYDGIWAPHWYDSVWKSRGFAKPSKKEIVVPDHLRGICEEARECYEYLKDKGRRIDGGVTCN